MMHTLNNNCHQFDITLHVLVKYAHKIFTRCISLKLYPKLPTSEVIAPAAPCAPRGQAVVLRRWQRIKDAVANGASDDAGTCPVRKWSDVESYFILHLTYWLKLLH